MDDDQLVDSKQEEQVNDADKQTADDKQPLTVKKTMWKKWREKKAANKIHSRNFTSGHINISEHHLASVGLRGRKRWFAWCGLAILLFIAIANLVLNCFLIAVLRLSPFGLPYISFMFDGRVIFIQPFNSTNITLNGNINSFRNHSINISSMSTIKLMAGPRIIPSTEREINSQLVLDDNLLKLRPLEYFSIYNGTNELFLINSSSIHFSKLNSVPQLQSNSVAASKILSSKEYLNISSGNQMNLIADSLAFQTQVSNVDIISSSNIRISFKDHVASAFIVQSKDGMILSNLLQYHSHNSGDVITYKLCICENGKLFRVTKNCRQANENINPCI
jgi:hypothetical protein